MLASGLDSTTESTASTGTDTDIVYPPDAIGQTRPAHFLAPTTPPKAATPLTKKTFWQDGPARDLSLHTRCLP